MIRLLGNRLIEVLKAVMPLFAVVFLLQVTIVHAPIALFVQFLVGSALATAGMLLLFLGIDLGVLPMGRFIGAELPKRGSILLIVCVGFATGFATTVAEPDVLVLASQIGLATKGRRTFSRRRCPRGRACSTWALPPSMLSTSARPTTSGQPRRSASR